MQKRLILSLLLLFTSLVATAQEDAEYDPLATTNPLIAYFNDELYQTVDGALEPYEACQPDEEMTSQFYLAPTGNHLLIVTLPNIVSEALATVGSVGDTPFGLNLWLCDTATDELERIFAVEGGDAAFDTQLPPSSQVQSSPVWSPDGRRIAWSILDLESEQVSLVFYDRVSTTLNTIPIDIVTGFSFPAPPFLYWVDETIFFVMPTLNDETFVQEDYLYTYDLASGALSEPLLISSGGEFDDFILDSFPIDTADDGIYLAQRLFEGGWTLLNVTTGEESAMDGLPALFSVNAPDGWATLMDIDEEYNYNWQIIPIGRVLNGYPRSRIAISPDGLAVAYADNTLNVRSEGGVIQVENSDGFGDDSSAAVIWGADEWRVVDEAAIVELPLPTCDGTLESRLRPGDDGFVRSIANNVRDAPSVSAARIGQINGSQEFTVLDGPVCADGFAWYQIQWDEFSGWTAEASDIGYWLAPIEQDE